MNEMNLDTQKSSEIVNDVEFWRNYFNERATASEIFETTLNSPNFKTKVSADVIGNKWLQFSVLMPKILCLLAGKVDSNRARMRLLKIAWEELGEGIPKHIHHETFKSCLDMAGIEVRNSLSQANSQIEKYAEGQFRSTSEIFGLGLGLEIIAVQNIDTVFNGLAYDGVVALNLQQSEFFEIHFQNEEGHIRHCLESFLRFCPDQSSKDDFIIGFENGLSFWKTFWNEVAEELGGQHLQSTAWPH